MNVGEVSLDLLDVEWGAVVRHIFQRKDANWPRRKGIKSAAFAVLFLCVFALRKISIRDVRVVGIWTTVAEELPSVANFADLVHVEIGHDQRVLVARALGDDL